MCHSQKRLHFLGTEERRNYNPCEAEMGVVGTSCKGKCGEKQRNTVQHAKLMTTWTWATGGIMIMSVDDEFRGRKCGSPSSNLLSWLPDRISECYAAHQRD